MKIATAVISLAAGIAIAAASGAFAQQTQPPGPAPGYGRGYGMGPGMMGGMMRGLWHLDLSDAQRQQILKIEDDLRRKNWELLGKQQEEQAKLREAYFGTAKRDRAAIIATYKRIGDLRVQRIENSLDAAEKIESVLTPQQRDQLRRWGPWWMMDSRE
jgi:Spy/CpxP family protein refolding chaperone